MKIILFQILVFFGFSKVYANTATLVKDIGDETKVSQAGRGCADSHGGSCGRT